ncbi:MAG: phosphate acyltransferase PlsX [Pseudomonadota bacterium]
MSQSITIAVDVMGADQSAAELVAGCAIALRRHPNTRFLMFGDEGELGAALENHGMLKSRTDVRHTDIVVAMDDKPSQALRRGRWRSSMWLSLDAVRSGEADVAVSAGNTGALMAMAKFCLRTMPGIERPAIAAIWPTTRGQSIVLDVGATIGSDAGQLVDFAVMGEAMARALFGLKRPSVGLLNIGVEEVKGLEPIREAGRILRDSGLPIDYAGFVEGTDIGKGTVDVVVTEGYTGNIALKTAEGTARQIAQYLRAEMSRSLLSRIGYLFAQGAFSRLRAKMDPRSVNGGVFLGLNGIVIKSHGGTDAEGFSSAVELGYEVAVNGLLEKIADDMKAHGSEQHADPLPIIKNAS